MMRRFLHNEIERAQTRRSHPAFFEQRFGGAGSVPLSLGDQSIRIHGILDRIDLCDDDRSQAIVIDYKTSASITFKALKNGKILQAPIYALAAKQVLGLSTIGVEFIRIKRGDTQGIYRPGITDIYATNMQKKIVQDDEWKIYLAQCQAQIGEMINQMETGNIALAPATTRCSAHCQYFPLCRGDQFTLTRKLREALREDEASAKDDPPTAE
jgi:ATP-dependent helicase/DNAse subunit B